MKFHDGTILDAEAVKLSFELGASQDLKRTRRNFFNFVEKIEAADQYTVRFTLKSPMTAFLERLSNGTAAIACPSLLARAKTKQRLLLKPAARGPISWSASIPPRSFWLNATLTTECGAAQI